MSRTTIAECLAPLVARWRADELDAPGPDNKTDGTLQYIITAPVEDGITGVTVFFEGKSLRAEIGTIENPTATITLTAQDMLDRYADTSGPQACQMRVERKIRIQGNKVWIMRVHAAT